MKSKVYFTKTITPEKVLEMYEVLGKELKGNIAVKLHSGEEGNQISDGMVSDITDRLLPQIEDWQKRPLDEVYPIVFIDAVHLSVRENGQIKSLQRMLFLLSVLQDISRYCPYISVKTRVQSTGLAF